MKQGSDLPAALSICPRVAVEGVWYRSVDAAIYRGFYDERHPMRPLWGLGAAETGARFTPAKAVVGRQIGSLYIAGDLETAMREGLHIKYPKPLKPNAGVTRAMYTVEVDLRDVVDVRESKVRRLLGTTLGELKEPWRYRRDGKTPETQSLGKATADSGIVGLLFQSSLCRGSCLVVFTENLKSGRSRLVVSDGGELLQQLP